jgi:hypothetical protein
MSKRVKAVKPSAKPATKQKSDVVSVPDSNAVSNKSSKKSKSKTTDDIASVVSKANVKPKRDRSKRTHSEIVADAQNKLGVLLDRAFDRGYARGYAVAKMSS